MKVNLLSSYGEGAGLHAITFDNECKFRINFKIHSQLNPDELILTGLPRIESSATLLPEILGINLDPDGTLNVDNYEPCQTLNGYDRYTLKLR